MYAASAMPCSLCKKPIDYRLKFPHRMSFSLEHRVPVWAGGSDTDPANLAAAHLSCNSSRGAREGNRLRDPRRIIQRPTSAAWHQDPPPPPGWERTDDVQQPTSFRW